MTCSSLNRDFGEGRPKSSRLAPALIEARRRPLSVLYFSVEIATNALVTMRTILKQISLVILTWITSANLGSAADRIEKSFSHGYVAFKDSDKLNKIRRMDEVSFDLAAWKDKPVVILIHGCSGMALEAGKIFSGYRKAMIDLARMDYLVIAPDSFAVSRGDNCKGLYGIREVQALRRAEVKYALDRLEALGFKRVYIFGHSEGGRTALTYGRWPSIVRGVVGMGWSCWDGEDISLPGPTPYIQAYADGDPIATQHRGCTIGPNGEFWHPKVPLHWFWDHPETKERILKLFAK